MPIRYFILDSLPEAILWAAWGTTIEKRSYLYDTIKDIKQIYLNRSWKQRGSQSKKGHPHHPLYVKKEATFEDFNIEGYVRNK